MYQWITATHYRLIAHGANITDKGLTAFMVVFYGVAVEANPVLRWSMSVIGIIPSLLVSVLITMFFIEANRENNTVLRVSSILLCLLVVWNVFVVVESIIP